MTSFGGSAAGPAPPPAPSVAEPSSLRVVVLADSPAETGRVVDCLAGAGYSVQLATQVDESVEVVVADFDAGGVDVLEALDAARTIVPAIPFVVMSGPLGADVAVDHVKRGVSDWVLKDRLDRLPKAVDQAIRHRIAADQEMRAIEARRETATRSREDAMADTLRRLGEARSLARIGNWEVDLATKHAEWSDELYELYGVRRDEFTPTLDGFCRLLSSEEAEELRRHVAHAERRARAGRTTSP